MGLFNRNKNEDIENEMLVIMGEIRDNLKINNDENLIKLESKIADAKYSNDEEIGVISTKIGKLEKLVELQDQTINKLEQRQDKYDEIINLIMDLVQSHSKVLEEQEQLKEAEVTEKPKNKRLPKTNNGEFAGKNYGNIVMDNIVKLHENGKFERKKRNKGGVYYKWNMKHLLFIKSALKQQDKYPSIKSIAVKLNISSNLVNELIWHIQRGNFDKYFNEWEQIQADKTYGNWEAVIENNPEKRKEQGIYG